MKLYPFLRGTSVLALLAAASVYQPIEALAQSATVLPDAEVVADKVKPDTSNALQDPVFVARQNLPQTRATTTRQQIEDTLNIFDAEDAVKYFPSVFVRKRNEGDTQPVLATRTWGVNSSARTLVYADDILLSALIANNNTIGAPRWGMIAPEEIERVDFLYGPYAAAYPGNSIGGVLQYTTKMPDKFFWDFQQNEAFQTFKQYGTNKVYPTSQTSAGIGNRMENFSWLLTGNSRIATASRSPMSRMRRLRPAPRAPIRRSTRQAARRMWSGPAGSCTPIWPISS